jgi:hypothetical protein
MPYANPQSGVYKITCKVNQKVYIGSAVNLQHRRRMHFRGSHNIHLNRAMRKYGPENFTFDILVLCEPENLTFVEQDQIDYWKKVKGWENLYNICEIAGSQLGTKCSEETRRKIRDGNKGKKHTEEAKKLMSEAQKGKLFSEEHRRKLSEAMKGRKRPDLAERNRQRTGDKHPNYGKQHSEETKKAISEAQKGDKHHMYGNQHTEQTKKLMSDAHKGKQAGDKHPQYDSTIYLFQHKSGKTFQGTQHQLRTKEGLHSSSLSAVVLGNRKSTGGFYLSYGPIRQ